MTHCRRIWECLRCIIEDLKDVSTNIHLFEAAGSYEIWSYAIVHTRVNNVGHVIAMTFWNVCFSSVQFSFVAWWLEYSITKALTLFFICKMLIKIIIKRTMKQEKENSLIFLNYYHSFYFSISIMQGLCWKYSRFLMFFLRDWLLVLYWPLE